MRKFLIPLLMASVAIPTAVSAMARPEGEREHSDRGRKDSTGDDSRRQRAEQSERSERQEERAERPVRIQRTERQDRSGLHIRQDRQVRVEQDKAVREVRRSEPTTVRVRRDSDRSLTGIPAQSYSRNRVSTRDRQWSSDWRRDHRYDWRNHRNSHRSLYRLSRYFDPYGRNYRRFTIGFNLWPSYYGSSYWLDDPWMYRLPPAYGPYRWVRYYDDALLVNIYTGQVADVLYNFFW